MRVRAILLTLAVAAIAAVMALRGRIGARGTKRADSGSRPPADAVAPVSPAASSAATPSPVAVPTRASEPAARTDQDDDGVSDSNDAKVVSIDGIVSVVDAEGREHHDESGELVLFRIMGDDDPKREAATVSNGKFRVDVPRDVCYGVKLVTLGGHPVDFDSCDVSRHSECPVTIHARRARPFRVRVVDATSGLDLHGITVVRDDDEVDEEALCVAPPPSEAVLLHDAASPIDLDAVVRDDRVEWDPRLHVTAGGHAWADIHVDYRIGGEVVVPLPRSARLRVKLKGVPEEAILRVCEPPDPVSPEDQKWFDEVGIRRRGACFASVAARDGAAIEFEALPTGSLVVTVEVGLPPCEVALGEAEVVLAPDETREVSIECRHLERPRRVLVSGTIEIQGEWSSSPFSLTLHPVRQSGTTVEDRAEVKSTEMERVSEEPLILRWKAHDLIPMEYKAIVYEFGMDESFLIGAEGRDDVKLVVGPCGDVLVRFVDSRTGVAVDDGFGFDLWWYREGDSNIHAGPFLSHDDDRHVYTGRLPVGRIRFDGDDHYFGDWSVDDLAPVDVRPGTNEFTFHVHRKCGVRLKLSCAGARIAWPEDSRISVDAEPEDETSFDERDEPDGGHVALVPHPGRYRVTLPPVPGFEPVPPFEVEFAAGPYVERVIELRRKQ